MSIALIDQATSAPAKSTFKSTHRPRCAPKKRFKISPRKLAANRRNADKSTGPRTPQGKKQSSQNSLKHGLCSQ
ncbi:MAG TPA: hypothetical protein VGP94_17275, partial [Tepidisphaeraceae bacterium]|nr:hypothetical protein [Tepidisphaeraceae bacterium]